jgi:hypothetical protein
MTAKRQLQEHERYGLTAQEVQIAEKYLRKNGLKGQIRDPDWTPLYDLYMAGYSFFEVSQEFPEFEYAQIILTAAVRKWYYDRQRISQSLQDRVRTKVHKSLLDQVNLITTVMTAMNKKHLKELNEFIIDPDNAPTPDILPKSMKEYKDVVEQLGKLVSAANTDNDKSYQAALMANLNRKRIEAKVENEEQDRHIKDDKEIKEYNKKAQKKHNLLKEIEADFE